MQSEHCGALSSLSWAHFRGLHLCWLIAYHCWLQNLIRSGLHPLGSTASNVAIRHLTHRFLRSIQCALRASSAGPIGREPVVVAVTHPPQFFFFFFASFTFYFAFRAPEMSPHLVGIRVTKKQQSLFLCCRSFRYSIFFSKCSLIKRTVHKANSLTYLLPQSRKFR